MTTSTQLDLAHAAFDRREWTAAAAAFVAADAAGPLDSRDLGVGGLSAHLSGDDDTAIALMTRSHQAAMAAGDTEFAAQMAFWLGMLLADRGDFAVAGGWLSRAQRIVEESGVDTVVQGYLISAAAIRALESGDPQAALPMFEEAAAYADRFREPDLVAMSRIGRGRSLIRLGEVERGTAMLDDAMLSVTSGEVSPVVVGIVYCAAIEAFREIYDVGRAQGWTEALTRWCAEQPDLVPYRGTCLVYRAELMRFHGAWPEAVEEADRAKILLLRPPPTPAAGDAFYLDAEVFRLRGDLDAAEAAYLEAAKRRPVEPGFALLRLAQGRPDVARAMIGRAIEETPGPLARSPLLEGLVEISIALGDIAAARAATDELAALAALTATPLLEAIASRADGVTLLAAGDPGAALTSLRRALDHWQALDDPYDAARARVEIGRACLALGDNETATIELASARATLVRLGAAPDVRRLDALTATPPPIPGGLSTREVEVIRLLVRGSTNREIATELGISERTVDRHVSNIYTKLDISSRAAATAFAYEHGLV